jgi:hypothetical protein
MKTFADDVRATILNASSSTFDREKALALYGPQPRLDQVLKADAERFTNAVRSSGGEPSVDFRTEPVNALSRKYSAELNTALAAAEAGLAVPEFQRRVRQSHNLVAVGFGQLLTDGGGFKRDAWEEHFAELVSEIGLGDAVRGQSGPVIGGDLTGTWVTKERRSMEVSGTSTRGNTACLSDVGEIEWVLNLQPDTKRTAGLTGTLTLTGNYAGATPGTDVIHAAEWMRRFSVTVAPAQGDTPLQIRGHRIEARSKGYEIRANDGRDCSDFIFSRDLEGSLTSEGSHDLFLHLTEGDDAAGSYESSSEYVERHHLTKQ